jgi:hypothetical protein
MPSIEFDGQNLLMVHHITILEPIFHESDLQDVFELVGRLANLILINPPINRIHHWHFKYRFSKESHPLSRRISNIDI